MERVEVDPRWPEGDDLKTDVAVLVSAAVVAVLVLALRLYSRSHAGARATMSDRWHALVVEDASPIVGVDGLTTEALGVETLGGVFTPLIEAGARIPCSRSEVFSTAADGQSAISVALFRGRDRMASRNHDLGRFKIAGIPAAPRGVPMVRITFAISERQILLSARDERRQVAYQVHAERDPSIPQDGPGR